MYDVVVIGAGAGGLVVAVGASKAGKKVLLIEKSNYGGDCTNFGCIPSKALIASSKVAHAIKSSENLGIKLENSTFNANQALSRVREIVASIRSHEEPEALKEHGVETLTATASFISPRKIKATDQNGNTTEIEGEKFIIATGSHPFIPPIPGLEGTPFLNNETIFDLKEIPESITFVGGGPINSELAQAFNRLGSKVAMIESAEHILNRESVEAKCIVEEILIKEGITIHPSSRAEKVSWENNSFSISLKDKVITSQYLFIGTGRKSSLDKLDLDNAKIKWSEDGIFINAYGQTSQKHIYAIGDATGQPFFTHRAEHHARVVLSNLILPFKKKVENTPLPRTTYTDPEVASVGLSEEDAIKKYGEKKIATYKVSFEDLDRAITEGRREGCITVVTKKWSSQILGSDFFEHIFYPPR